MSSFGDEVDDQPTADPIEATTTALQTAIQTAATDTKARRALCESIAQNLVALAEAVRNMA